MPFRFEPNKGWIGGLNCFGVSEAVQVGKIQISLNMSFARTLRRLPTEPGTSTIGGGRLPNIQTRTFQITGDRHSRFKQKIPWLVHAIAVAQSGHVK